MAQDDLTLNRPTNLRDVDLTLPVRSSSDYLTKNANFPSTHEELRSGLDGTLHKPGVLSDLFQRNQTTPGITPTEDDFNITYSSPNNTLTDYILVRLPGRVNADGDPLVFRFLINPNTIEVSYNTVDVQSLTRTGWQFGVWGEDLVQISMSGKTAGSYFSEGLSEKNKIYSRSYRNLINLKKVFENNGYWFEGEGWSSDDLRTDNSRKRIQCHEDVQLIYNNFVWYGMFESLSHSSVADNPYVDSFKLTFVAWKERSRGSSPWKDSIHNDLKKGHTRGAGSQQASAKRQAEQQQRAEAAAVNLSQQITANDPINKYLPQRPTTVLTLEQQITTNNFLKGF